MIAIAVLTVCLLNSFPSKINNIHDWQFWIFPIILLVDSISQSIKEFYMEFNIVVIAFTIYSMYTLGVEVSQIGYNFNCNFRNSNNYNGIFHWIWNMAYSDVNRKYGMDKISSYKGFRMVNTPFIYRNHTRVYDTKSRI